METIELIQHRASIAGYVTDSQSGGTIPGAVVHITAKELKTKAAVDGFFYFLDLDPGQYTIEVSAPDCGSVYGTVTAVVQVPDVGEGQAMFFVWANVALPPTTLSGKVTRSSDNSPIQNAVVQVLGSEQNTSTDSSGNYSLWPLQAGAPNIKASADGFVELIQTATLVAGKEREMNFSLGG